MKIGVIADDLTGGNGTGVKLTKLGYNVATMVFYENLPSSEEINGVIIDTDSRYIKKAVARRRVKTAAANLKKWDTDILCKRIDSTVRGNIGVELDSILHELGEESIAIVIPAYPDSGRIVSGGYLLIHGVPVQLSDVGKDPVKPVTESHIPKLVQKQSNHQVAGIDLETILAGKEMIEADMLQKIEKGARILVPDAITNENIESIACAMAELDMYQMVPADPGPLTSAYARAFSRKRMKDKKIIITVGSVTSNSSKQLQYLIDKTNLRPIYVDAKKLAKMDSTWDQEVERVIKKGAEEMEKQDILLFTTDSLSSEILNLKTLAEKEHVSQDALAKRIADGLGKITRLTIQNSRFEIGGCFTSGGDVTASLCSISRAEGIQLMDEILPLVAYGKFIGGYLDGIPIVTKGGTAGDTKAIYTSVKYLEATF
ncbi:four-carbon acid sugar kinase family protein [Bacillus paralicheniformis]|uniref:Putative type III effector Hop protein n=1 Tax=Bacillus paralicheniformis TaxID=1648923 RepID=A0A7Z0X147_9BACI|nr:four-carbon acid sugar kinase family protein [Bacillus paralicheniformis]MBC8623762.1 four-carbon acid sugar kinase family protein [Robertmurraya crescens]MCU4669655.1 four-carbon acid sugar kinase family protein [Bacillus paralicheniformis]MDU0413454.1 four-carbon acid sugar kinase family protein [Bacillus paralicheniformis]MEC1823976.1 four-carbon acid sugar kinase family protein [Bacillus paralicheniformis]OLF96742.1 putative type III effector Hop protein [Bacillus paralicheniformis]